MDLGKQLARDPTKQWLSKVVPGPTASTPGKSLEMQILKLQAPRNLWGGDQPSVLTHPLMQARVWEPLLVEAMGIRSN